MDAKMGFIAEPVKEVKIIADDMTIVFESPKVCGLKT